MNLQHDVRTVARQFQIYGEFLGAESYGSGHINDTYRAVFDQAGAPARYIIQRINHNIFKAPVAVMDNIRRVTTHLAAKAAGAPDFSRRVLTLVATRDGGYFHRDEQANHWRAYLFIEKARTCDAVESAEQAFKAAQAFGAFQKLLADLPAPRLHDTIPDFHHTPKRFAALEKVIAADAVNRAAAEGRRIVAVGWPARKLNLPCAARKFAASSSTPACRSVSRTTTPSSTTSCSTRPPAKASV